MRLGVLACESPREAPERLALPRTADKSNERVCSVLAVRISRCKQSGRYLSAARIGSEVAGYRTDVSRVRDASPESVRTWIRVLRWPPELPAFQVQLHRRR